MCYKFYVQTNDFMPTKSTLDSKHNNIITEKIHLKPPVANKSSKLLTQEDNPVMLMFHTLTQYSFQNIVYLFHACTNIINKSFKIAKSLYSIACCAMPRAGSFFALFF
jgi:hypothetical protein